MRGRGGVRRKGEMRGGQGARGGRKEGEKQRYSAARTTSADSTENTSQFGKGRTRAVKTEEPIGCSQVALQPRP